MYAGFTVNIGRDWDNVINNRLLVWVGIKVTRRVCVITIRVREFAIVLGTTVSEVIKSSCRDTV